MANAKTSITDEQIFAVIHDKEKSRKDREREAVDMVRQQMAEVAWRESVASKKGDSHGNSYRPRNV